jgi:N-acetyl sugar amidotransferase
MDTSDPDIIFDKNGVCSHCLRYKEELPKRVFKGKEAESRLNRLILQIKSDGKNNEYDCIIGVSGGVDSTYVAYLAKKLGLRSLAIHFDNGWNSELAVSNIEKTLDKLGIDLYTYVIDWEEFRDLQLSFLKASTPDGEIPTDHAIYALLFKQACKRNIKYILSGMNFATESMSVKSWSYGHSDWKYIRAIHKKFGASTLKSYPHFNFFDLFRWTYLNKIQTVSILNYIQYNKKEVMNILQNELNWVYYGGKHYESVYTRFFQGYILPQKFNIDKRRAHLSDLINSGQINRDTALSEIEKIGYDPTLMEQDKQFVMKKLHLTYEKFEEVIQLPKKTFNDYPNNQKKVALLKRFVNQLRKKGLYTK